MRGRLTSDGAAVGGATVHVQLRARHHWDGSGLLRTRPDGRFRHVVAGSGAVRLRIVFVGTGLLLPAVSDTVRLRASTA